MNAPRRHSRPEPEFTAQKGPPSGGKAKKVSSGPTKPTMNQYGDVTGRSKMGEKSGARKKMGC